MIDAEIFVYGLYAAPLVVIWVLYVRRHRTLHARSVETLTESHDAGLIDPVSLHPVIDPGKCIGCASCVAACPETPAHQVLGMVRRKAMLVSPTDCIGHGACQAVCPVECCIPDDDRREEEKALLERALRLHPDDGELKARAEKDDFPSRFRVKA